MNKAVPYYRVSTERQGASGLGLEAQQKAVREYANRFNLLLIDEFIEVETGKQNNRPVLLQALEKCKEEDALLLIAKLDRLGRNTVFIATIMESDIDFVAVDNPEASKLILHVMAAFAEWEGDQISQRTKEALAAAKKKGVRLGKYGRDVLSQRNRQQAEAFARKMRPVIESLQQEGIKSIRDIAKTLNRRKIKTYSGKAKWHVQTVYSLMNRIKHLSS